MRYETAQEMNAFKNRVQQARLDGDPWMMLEKNGETEVFSFNQQHALEQLGGRTKHHVLRLLQPERTAVEHQFGETLCESGQQALLHYQPPVQSHIRAILNGTTPETTLVWTMGPYILEELTTTLPRDGSLTAFFDWVKEGSGTETIALPGLAEYNFAIPGQAFTLGLDPRGPSHILAEEEAKRIAREFIQNHE